jgi:hypothetical protein
VSWSGRRLWRYEVTEVWGSMADRLDVGSIRVSPRRTPPEWLVVNLHTGDHVGGWSAKVVDEYLGPRDDAGRPVSEPA